jgi:hypothetical protein
MEKSAIPGEYKNRELSLILHSLDNVYVIIYQLQRLFIVGEKWRDDYE